MFPRHRRISLILIFAVILSCGNLDRFLDLNNGPVGSTWTVHAAPSISYVTSNWNDNGGVATASFVSPGMALTVGNMIVMFFTGYRSLNSPTPPCETVTSATLNSGDTLTKYLRDSEGCRQGTAETWAGTVTKNGNFNVTVNLTGNVFGTVTVVVYSHVNKIGNVASTASNSTVKFENVTLQSSAGNWISGARTWQGTSDSTRGFFPANQTIRQKMSGVDVISTMAGDLQSGAVTGPNLFNSCVQLNSVVFCNGNLASSAPNILQAVELVNGDPASDQLGGSSTFVGDPRVDIVIGSVVAVGILAAMLFFIVRPRRK